MTAVWIAVWIGVGAPAALYVTKRLVDAVLPPDRHFPWLDRFTVPNKPSKEDTDEN